MVHLHLHDIATLSHTNSIQQNNFRLPRMTILGHSILHKQRIGHKVVHPQYLQQKLGPLLPKTLLGILKS